MSDIQPRLVGWLSNAEWLIVYEKLFSNKFEEEAEALEIIRVWRCKFGITIPVAIEVTSRLFEAKHSSQNNNNYEGCLALSCAITQFLGLVTEKFYKNTNKSENGGRLPIHVVAENIGIPEWLTNIRHDTAHDLLRSYPVCKKAADFAINWLKQNHWDVQFNHVFIDNDIIKIENAIKLFGDFRQDPNFHVINNYLKKYIQCLDDQKDILKIQCEICSIFQKDEKSVYVFCYCLFEGNFIYYPRKDEDKNKGLLWKSFISNLFNLGKLPCFFHLLTLQLCENFEDSKSDVLLQYALFCLNEFRLQIIKLKKAEDDFLGNFWKNIIKLISSSYNKYFDKIYATLKSLNVKKLVGNQFIKKVDKLIKINHVECIPEKNCLSTSLNSDNHFGVGKLTSEKFNDAVSCSIKKVQNSKWMVCNSNMFGKQIGILPTQDLETLPYKLFNIKNDVQSKVSETFVEETMLIDEESSESQNFVDDSYCESEMFKDEETESDFDLKCKSLF